MGPTCNVRHEQALEMGPAMESGLRILVFGHHQNCYVLGEKLFSVKMGGVGLRSWKKNTQYFHNLFGQNFDFQKDAKVWGVLQIGKVVPIYDLDFSQIWKLSKIHRFFGKSGFEPK